MLFDEWIFQINAADGELAEMWFIDHEISIQICDQTTLQKAPEGFIQFIVTLPLSQKADFEKLIQEFPIKDYIFSTRTRRQEEWQDNWKQFFSTKHIANFDIVPSWEAASYIKKAHQIPLWIDPGQAFGTGNHETTQLCMQLIAEFDSPAPEKILDVGAGSGILSLAALKKWPDTHAVALDIDPLAVEATMFNAQINHVADRLVAIQGSLEQMTGNFSENKDDINPPLSYDLILANLTAPVLYVLAKELSQALLPAGRLVISGFLKTEQAALLAYYQQMATDGIKLEVEKVIANNEWGAAQLKLQISESTAS